MTTRANRVFSTSIVAVVLAATASLAGCWQGNSAATYQDNWANEMHPNVLGFRALAAIIDEEIQRRQ